MSRKAGASGQSAQGAGAIPAPAHLTKSWLHRFVHIPWLDDEFAYWHSFRNLWDAPSVGTIVNVEWDMEFTPQLVRELEECPHSLCTHAYRMYLPRAYWAHGLAPADDRRLRGEGIEWGSKADEWATWSAIGFCKIAAEARRAPLARANWLGVEASVNNAVTGRWHIHWPGVKHYHKDPR